MSRTVHTLIATTVVVVSALVPMRATAQEPADQTAPAHIAYVDGTATLERDGQLEAVSLNMPVVPGDRLRTTTGRIELLFPDATALDIDEDTSIEMLSPTLFRLSSGRALLTVAGAGNPSGAARYRFDTPAASVDTDGPGEFRIAVSASSRDETELAVIRGFARLANERGATDVRAGERTVSVEGGAPTRPQMVNSARFDPFDRWIAERRGARVTAASDRYLPAELRLYGGTLNRYGSWEYMAPHGHVWRPIVSAGWQPYYQGHWSSVGQYGWTWIGADAWSWPTHHYGRWGHARGEWFWIPGRTWGPAWVSWAMAPDYVSWSPLGFDGRPVFALSIGVVEPWGGWVVLPRTAFGHRGYRVDRFAVARHRIPRSTPFIHQSRPPVAAGRDTRYVSGSPGGRRPVAPVSEPLRPPVQGESGRRSEGRTLPGQANRSPEVAIPRDVGRRRETEVFTRPPGVTESRPQGDPQGPAGQAGSIERAMPRDRGSIAPPPRAFETPAYRGVPERAPERRPDRSPAPPSSGASPAPPSIGASPAPPPSAPDASSGRRRTGTESGSSAGGQAGERAVPRGDSSTGRSRGERQQ